MKDLLKENNQQKHQFKSYYCARCRQRKPCQLLTGWDSEWKSYCCVCYYQREQVITEEYSSYEKVLGSKQKEKENRVRQYQILRGYQGCKVCKSLAVDACSLYENSQLVCQPCLARKTGGSSSPISFLGQKKWFQKRWGVDISWWLETYRCLPVNAECAREWLKERSPLAFNKDKDKEHLRDCQCLEKEVKESYELVNDNLESYQKQLKECRCEISPKVRVDSDYYGWCEKCKVSISVASKKRVIKNRNDPRFWEIKSEFKILCLKCLGKRFYRQMEDWQRKKFREYVRRGYE